MREDWLCFSEVKAVKSVTDAWERDNQTTIRKQNWHSVIRPA